MQTQTAANITLAVASTAAAQHETTELIPTNYEESPLTQTLPKKQIP